MNIIDQAKYIRTAMDKAGAILTDDQAAATSALFMPWKTGTVYVVGDRRRYNDLLYKCLQAHSSQADWTPDIAVSLWVRIDDPATLYPEWVQPVGTEDAYALGAKVMHDGLRWISSVDANVWEPGVYGWE
jgi:hypothetical protein